MKTLLEFLQKAHISNSSEYIDLGLPSGTLWCSTNLGASKPEEIGLYYQWGSLEGHEEGTFDFDKDNYFKNYSEDYQKLSQLKKEDDAAYAESGGLARIPTRKQLKELIYNCKYKWTTLNKVKGVKFTGPNGNFIFIPAGGFYADKNISDKESINIWSLSINYYLPSAAYYMYCASEGKYVDDSTRSCGFNIRPVKN